MAKSRILILCSVLLGWGFTQCQNSEKAEADEVGHLVESIQPVLAHQKVISDSMAQQVISTSFGVLSGALKAQIKTNGAAAAVSYCHENATGLADSISNVVGIHVQRVALKNRNPQNALSEMDAEAYQWYENQMAQEGQFGLYRPEAQPTQVVYAPIIMQAPCLQCHGNLETEILPETAKNIQNKYPQDAATGFKVGQLRGMWKLSIQ